MGSMSIWHWLILLVIVLVVFGTKKLPTIGKDVGNAFRGFKDGMREGEAGPPPATVDEPARVGDRTTIDVEAKEKTRP